MVVFQLDPTVIFQRDPTGFRVIDRNSDRRVRSRGHKDPWAGLSLRQVVLRADLFARCIGNHVINKAVLPATDGFGNSHPNSCWLL